jgi:hypothetical protein
MLDGTEREAFRAAARVEAALREPRGEPAPVPVPTPGGGRPRWRRRGAALGAVLVAGLIIAAPLAWSRASGAQVANASDLTHGSGTVGSTITLQPYSITLVG